jgi:hypothetical protein
LRTPSLDRLPSPVEATVLYGSRPWSAVDPPDGSLAVLTTEYAENDYPALPVRVGEHALVVLASPGVAMPAVPGVVRTERLRLER